MNCPNCKEGILKEDISVKGLIWNRRKIYTYFCPLCSFENSKVIKVNEDEYQAEIKRKQNTKFNIYRTEKELE